jgi:FkbM family methyltransferase
VIFVDVGAHEGQTLAEVTKLSYPFSRIVAFEPMPAQFATLVAVYGNNARVELHNVGLSDATGRFPMFGANDQLEASIYATKDDVDPAVVTECGFVAASEAFAGFGDEPLLVKLNCEGAEIRILDDLIISDAIWQCADVMIDFDIRKVPGREHEEEDVLKRLAAIGFDRYSLCDDVMHGATHQERIAHWLRGVL